MSKLHKAENLFLITSVLIPSNKPLSYIPIRSVYTPNERFVQTVETVKSIREKVPNSYIYWVEGSYLPSDIEQQVKILCDRYTNVWYKKELREQIDSTNKSLGEATLILEALSQWDGWKQFNNYFKISGRYFLNDGFDLNTFNNTLNVFQFRNTHYATTLYKIHLTHMHQYIQVLNDILIPMTKDKNLGIEWALFNMYPPTHPDNSCVSRVGVSGLCSVVHNCLFQH